MKVLILNQAFYPDVVSVAHHAADLAAALAGAGHEVTVVASRRAYDPPSQTFPQSEVWRGVRVFRVRSTAFGKAAHCRRAPDMLSFYPFCTKRLALLPRLDVAVAMTVPPLISLAAALFVRLKSGSLISWVMDLNPDESVAAGALREGPLLVRGLSGVLQFSLCSSAALRDRVEAPPARSATGRGLRSRRRCGRKELESERAVSSGGKKRVGSINARASKTS